MDFSIRDDDTSFFTPPELLEAAYGDVWNHAPVSLAVVPFQGRTRTEGIPRTHWESGTDVFPLGHNGPLVAMLRTLIDRGRVAVLLHGYSHVDLPSGHEFEAGADLEQKVGHGRRYLEGLFFRPVTAFVPPHNAFSARGHAAVVAQRLNIVQIVPFRGRRAWLASRAPVVLRNAIRVAWARARWRQPYPHVLDFGTHREVAFVPLTPASDPGALLRRLEFCQARGGVFVVATHHWELNRSTRAGPTLKAVLHRLVDRGEALGARFRRVDDLLAKAGR